MPNAPRGSDLAKEAGIGDASRREQARASGERAEASRAEAFRALEAPLQAKVGHIAETRAATAGQLDELRARVAAAQRTRKLLSGAVGGVKDDGLQQAAEQLDQDVRILEGVQRRL